MNVEGIEKAKGKVCAKCKVWKPLGEYNKNKNCKDGMRSECKKCQKEYNKQYRENNKERIKEVNKQWKENNKEYYKEYKKQWEKNNKEYIKEQRKQYKENNKEQIKEQRKQYRKNNKEHIKEYNKQYRENNKENNLQYISNVVEQINPVFKQLNLPIYGYIYKFENIKTGHKYVGQSIKPIKERYKSNIIKGWIKERLDKSSQKFTEELIEEDIKLTEVLDVAFCQYHLDKLEAYYIDKYDSCNNGYNNNAGYWNRDDGLDEFNEILKTYNLQYIDGKIIKAPTQE